MALRAALMSDSYERILDRAEKELQVRSVVHGVNVDTLAPVDKYAML